MSDQRRTDGHCVQYALVRHAVIYDTDRLSDEEIRQIIKQEPIKYGCGDTGQIERYNRCPLCESWTTMAGKLRPEIKCPAVQERIGK